MLRCGKVLCLYEYILKLTLIRKEKIEIAEKNLIRFIV